MGTNGSFKTQELNIYGMIKKLGFYKPAGNTKY